MAASEHKARHAVPVPGVGWGFVAEPDARVSLRFVALGGESDAAVDDNMGDVRNDHASQARTVISGQRPLSSRMLAFLHRSLRYVATHPWVAILLRRLNHEGMRLAVLVSGVLYILRPFMSKAFFGAADATWYNFQLHDVLMQIQSGIFPVYVGQGEFHWNGFPIARSPYFYYLGILVYLLTGRHLDPIVIQHLTVVTTGLTAALLLYLLLVNIEPTLRWESVALSLLYLTCPGVLGLVYTTDQYTSWMTLPYLPSLTYGIIRLIRNNDYLASLIIGVSLSLLWMSHPPIALWATIATSLALVFTAILTRRIFSTVRRSLVSFLIFALLSSWYFVSVFSMGLGTTSLSSAKPFSISSLFNFAGPAFIVDTLREIHAVMPGVFLPVSNPPAGMTAFQLGYSLWLLGLLSLWMATRYFDISLITLLVCTLSFIGLLYPIPYVTSFIWHHLPRIVEITQIWPMQRLYVIVAALSCFLGLISIRRCTEITALPRSFLLIMLTALSIWSSAEATKFLEWGRRKATWTNSKSILLSENVRLGYSFLPGARSYSEDYYDPVLENRVLDASNPALRTSNLESVTLQPLQLGDHDVQSGGISVSCHNDNCSLGLKGGPFPATDSILPLLNVRIAPNKRYILSFRHSFKGYKGTFQLVGENFLREYRLSDQGVKKIPLWTSEPGGKELTLRFIGSCSKADEHCSAEFQSISVGTYEHTSLPIKISSLIPYSALIEVKAPVFLETHRLYFPGYHASVNGNAVPVARSPEGMAMIPLTPGQNNVTMEYAGTPLMRLAFWVSTISWVGLWGVPGIVWIRNRVRRPYQEIKEASASRLK